MTKAKLLDGFIYKNYSKKDLLDENWPERINLINGLESHCNIIPKTEIHSKSHSDALVYKQRYVESKSFFKLGDKSTLRQLMLFSQGLDALSEKNFVHGDINRRNIVHDGKKIFLVDIEPSLRVRQAHRETLLYTFPYISVSDFILGKLTLKSDKVGFFWYCLRLHVGHILQIHRVSTKLLRTGKSPIDSLCGLSEEEITDSCFFKIAGLNWPQIIYEFNRRLQSTS